MTYSHTSPVVSVRSLQTLSQSPEGTAALPKSEVPSMLCSAGPSCGSQPDGASADTPQMFINITQTALTICHQSSRAPEKQRAALQARHSPEQHQNNHQTHLTGKRVIFTLCTDARFHLLHILKHAWRSYYTRTSPESHFISIFPFHLTKTTVISYTHRNIQVFTAAHQNKSLL